MEQTIGRFVSRSHMELRGGEYLGESYDYSDDPTSPIREVEVPEKFSFALPYDSESEVSALD